MSVTKQVPLAYDAASARISSMRYADVYGASDDTGPSSAVAGSLGYVSATEMDGAPAAPAVGTIAASQAEGGIAGLTELGHSLLDSHAGIAFIVGGGLLLLAWHELA